MAPAGTRPDCPFVILCGGDNTRLEVLQGTVYKPFLKLRTTTLVAKHVVRAMRFGHRTIRIVVDERDPLLTAYVRELGEDVGADVQLMVVPGDANAKISGVLQLDHVNGPVVVVLGDTYAWYDPDALLAKLSDDGPYGCIAVTRYRLPFGVVDMCGGSVIAFREKPTTEYFINLGIMAVHEKALQYLQTGQGVGEMLANLAANGQLGAVELPGGFINVDSLDGVARAFGPEGEAILDN